MEILIKFNCPNCHLAAVMSNKLKCEIVSDCCLTLLALKNSMATASGKMFSSKTSQVWDLKVLSLTLFPGIFLKMLVGRKKANANQF